MATTEAKDLLEAVTANRYNPSGIQRAVLSQLSIDVVDATNPFVFLLQSSAVNTAAFMVENAANNRKQYPSVAQTVDDIYLHMSDKDYIDRFASPSKTKFSIIVPYDELIAKMVHNTTTGIRKVTIPRNSEFTVGDYTFSLQYPIDIKLLAHGSLQIVFNTDKLSPLQTLETNQITWSARTNTIDNTKVVYLEFEVYQIEVEDFYGDLNSTTGYNRLHTFNNQFYHARVFYKNTATDNQWVEMHTTHSDQVYDPLKPTAVLKVVDNDLQVSVPQIYFTTNQVSGSLRVDVYQTKGELAVSLSNFKPSAFEANWRTIDKSEATAEVAAWRSIASVFAYSDKTISGGKSALSFDTLRQRVIENSVGPQQIPITPVQIQTSLQNEGFEVVRNVDVVTNRAFLATRALPKPFDEKLITAGATSIESLIVSTEQAGLHSGTRVTGRRMTLTPEILYENINGVVTMVPSAELQSIVTGDTTAIAKAVNSRTFLYTPFHYVLDTSNDTFDVRPYYLSHPKIPSIEFIAQNDTTGLQVNTASFTITKNSRGYKIYVETLSNTAYRTLDDSHTHVQLSFIPKNEENRCYLTGTLFAKRDSGERVFEFTIDTNFDIDTNDQLSLDSFQMYSAAQRSLPSALLSKFDLFYISTGPTASGWSTHEIDSKIGKFLLPGRVSAINHEQLTVEFGVTLKNLWASYRSMPASAPYAVHQHDVALTYEEDEYERDPATGQIFTFNAAGQLVYNQLHTAGDPVLDSAGEPVYRHRAGDVLLTSSGQPVPTGADLITRQIDMFFIEGSYYFATDTASSTYREAIVATVVDWINVSLFTISKKLLEKTKLFYYPKTTMGTVKVMVENGIVTYLEAGQSMAVKLYVRETVFENAAIREALTVKTIEILDQQLKNTTVSISTITTALRAVYGEDVLALTVSGLGGVRNLQMFTMMDADERCSIRKRLTALPDGKLIVQEDVSVDFVRHE